MSCSLALLLMTVISTGLLGAVALAPLWAVSGALVVIRRHGRSLIDWAPIVIRYAHRRRTGQTLCSPGPSPGRGRTVSSTFRAPPPR
ncbi:hypothetical protein SMICM17S_05655 [Streptomyces microflavus]